MTEKVSTLAREEVRKLSPYVCARDLYSDGDVFLDANENAFGSAVGSSGVELNRYPDPNCAELRRELARYCGVDARQLMVGNGSDEIISIAATAFAEKGRNVITVQPGYSMWGVCAQIAGAEERRVLMGEDFEIDVNAIAEKCDTETKMIFMANPDCATGKPVSEESVRKVLDSFKGVVFVDEAYFEFCGKTFVPLLREYDRLIVSRTFSKAWGLASLRVGYCIASPGVVSAMRRIKLPYNVNGQSQSIATKAMAEGRQTMLANVKRIMEEREKLAMGLAELGCRAFEGEANFVLARLPAWADPKVVQQRLASDARIVVRDRSSLPLLAKCIRFTVGTPEENGLLLGKLGEILGR